MRQDVIQSKGLWERAKEYLDSLPNDEVLTAIELARAIGSSRPSLNVNIDYARPEIALRTMVVNDTTPGAQRKRLFGNPVAIRKLRKTLEMK